MASYQPPSKRVKLPACVNCGILTDDRFCQLCCELPECIKCHKRLQKEWFRANSNVCSTCSNQLKEYKKYSLGHVFSVTTIPSDESCKDMEAYIHGSAESIMGAISEAIQEHRSIKFFVKVDVELYRSTESGLQYMNATFRSDVYQIGNLSEVKLDEIAKHLGNKLDLFNERGSGWILGYITKCTVNTALYRPLAGSSYLPTPPFIMNKKAVVNIENFDDDLCFIWSVLAHLHHTKEKPNRLSHYKKFQNELNIDGLTFPLPVSDVSKFEKLNANLKINVLMYEEKDFIPL